MTLEQQNAVAKGEQYLAIMGFSRSGLIAQLEFEGFPVEVATFAADTIAPDWNAEAAEKAQQYLDTLAFSRQALIDQLVFRPGRRTAGKPGTPERRRGRHGGYRGPHWSRCRRPVWRCDPGRCRTG
jgi:hypothetical protein